MKAKPGVSDPMRIRAHHLLCMQGFQGYGYSKEFAEAMALVVEHVLGSNNLELEITANCDEICIHCPHNVDYICKDHGADENIKRMDETVLQKLGIIEGSNVESGIIFEYVNETFRTREDAREVCGDCIWSDKCLWFMGKPL
ncbi:DUF1284 domain-containing protein [Methanobacterium congolense]|nr:DUF1284 domain-containing protein [Methanobacterium congolense]